MQHQSMTMFRQFIARLQKIFFIGLATSFPLLALVGDVAHGQGNCRIVGFAHAFDVVTVPVCNFWGHCVPQQQQIPCQHPLRDCR